MTMNILQQVSIKFSGNELIILLSKRMEFLFELYEKHTADLFTKEKTKKNKLST